MSLTQTHQSGHTHDLVITRASDSLVSNLHTYNPLISDHEAVVFNLQVAEPPPVSKTISYLCLGKIDFDKFVSDITASPLLLDPPLDVSDISNHYNLELSKILDNHAPLKSKTIVERLNCEWFNDDLGDQKRALRKLELKYKQSNLAIDKDIYDLKCAEYDESRKHCHDSILYK